MGEGEARSDGSLGPGVTPQVGGRVSASSCTPGLPLPGPERMPKCPRSTWTALPWGPEHRSPCPHGGHGAILQPCRRLFHRRLGCEPGSGGAGDSGGTRHGAPSLSTCASLLQANADPSVISCLHNLSRRIATVLQHEERRCQYLTREAKLILALQDEVSAMADGEPASRPGTQDAE